MVFESHIGVYMSIAPETTYGTYTETSQLFIPIMSETLTAPIQHITREAEATGDNRWRRKPVKGQIGPHTGTITGHFYLDDIAGYILRAAFGAATSATLSGSAFTHYWFPGPTQNNSLSIEIRRGGNSTPWRFAGGKITALRFSLDNAGVLIYEMDLIFQTRSDGDVDTVSGIGTTIAPRFFESSTTDDGGSAINLLSWNLAIDFGLNVDPGTLFKHGSQTIIEPTPVNEMAVSGSVTRLFDSADGFTDYNRFAALTELERLITLTTTQAIPSGGSSEVFLVKFDIPLLIIESDPQPQYGGQGPIQISYDWRAYGGTSDNSNTDVPIEITVQNGTASYT